MMASLVRDGVISSTNICTSPYQTFINEDGFSIQHIIDFFCAHWVRRKHFYTYLTRGCQSNPFSIER